MATHRVLVTDYTWESTAREAAVLDEVDGELIHAVAGDPAELVALVADCDAILTCFKQVTAEVVRAAPALQVIGRYGIGTDNIAVATASELGIPVTNVPEYCVDEVAEHVLAMIFCLVRGLHRYDRTIRTGDWSLAPGLPTRRIRGATLGIVGHGAIGHALQERAGGLGMNVIIHSRRGGAGLFELAERSDFVSIHVPAAPETQGLISAEFIAAMKSTAYLINAARGTVLDHDALVAALEAGAIAGAGLDVFSPEPLAAEDPLLQLENTVLTPHTAFYSDQSIETLAVLAARAVADVLAGRRPASVVNPEVLELPRWAHLR